MSTEFNHLASQEKLKAENEFLKMKLMLETGAEFGGMPGSSIPPEVENQFLLSIVEFEQQASNVKYIPIFEKLGRPVVRPVDEIPDEEIDSEWKDLLAKMREKGVSLDVCSPNISSRELYRFTVEELFNEEMADMDIPGMSTNFIYDEFHPDSIYENTLMVEDHLMANIFSIAPLFSRYDFADEGFLFNGHRYSSSKEFASMLDRFKSLFDDIGLKKINIDVCTVMGKVCKVDGYYEAFAESGGVVMLFTGTLHVSLRDAGYGWLFTDITINGFDPGK